MRYDLSRLKDLDESSYKPLNVQLSEILIGFIRDANLPPGAPFPSESELIERFGISRMTVRAALIRIATEGLIYKIQGKGTFVAGSKLSQKISAFESLETNLSRRGLSVESVPLELIKVQPVPIWLKNLELPAEEEVVRTARLKKIDGQIFAIEHAFLPLGIADRFSSAELENEPIIDLFGKFSDTKVYRIIHVSRSHIIFEYEANLLGIPNDSPVLTRRFTYYNRKNKPICTGRITYVGDFVELEVELSRENGKQEKIRLKRGDGQ